MKWYIWAAIGIALVLIIWAVTKKKPGSGSTTLASNTAPGAVGTSYSFNPYQLTPIV